VVQDTITQNLALGDFLRARRAALDPALVGSPAGAGRRVPGLRREELAQLVGVSVDYYTRLEQGRRITPSDGVLTALAGALRLDNAQRTHLFDLSRGQFGHRPPQASAPQAIRPALLRLLETLGDTAAMVVGRRTDILAANATARALFADFNVLPAHERNVVRWMLLEPRARTLLTNWASDAAAMVGILRLHAGRYPNDPRVLALIEELTEKSPEFPGFWTSQHVTYGPPKHKFFNHPVVGEFECEVETLTVSEDHDQSIIVLMPRPDATSEDAMRRLRDYSRRRLLV
jgi:transcriptional regulator with XRE-family HTH domain